MCWCTPEIRTPNCGAIGCHPPRNETLVKENEMLRRILAVARMINNQEPDIRMTSALRDWDKRDLGFQPAKDEK